MGIFIIYLLKKVIELKKMPLPNLDLDSDTDLNYKFKPEFEDKLNRLGIKEKFVKNVKDCIDNNINSKNNLSFTEYCRSLDTYKSWSEFVFNGFIWDDTPEGRNFWMGIYKLEDDTVLYKNIDSIRRISTN